MACTFVSRQEAPAVSTVEGMESPPRWLPLEGEESMSSIVPFQQPSAAVQRRVQRELGELTISAGMTQARIQAGAEIEAARASAVASVGQRAMQEVAMLT